MPDENIKRENSVKVLQKAFLIIEEINKKDEMSILEISENLKMDKTTVHRIVTTVKSLGYITQNPDTKKYSVSLKVFAMGSRVAERTGVKKIARPYIERLAEETKETVNLGLKIDGNISYIDKIESRSTIKVGIDVGTSIPDYCTGMGKAVLAFVPEEERKLLISNITFVRFTKNTIMNQEELEQNLTKIKEKGYSMDNEEYVDGLISFGAPIMDYHGNAIGAISVSYPKYRYETQAENEKAHSIFPQKVVDAAAAISRQLGYKDKY